MNIPKNWLITKKWQKQTFGTNIDDADDEHGDVENNLETDVHTIHSNQQNVMRKMEEKLERFGNIWQKKVFWGIWVFMISEGKRQQKNNVHYVEAVNMDFWR